MKTPMESAPANTQETPEQKRERFAMGHITEQEIAEYWKNPKSFLAEHIITRNEHSIKVRVHGFKPELKEALWKTVKESWGMESDYNDLVDDTRIFLEGDRDKRTDAGNDEYYILTDEHDVPLGLTGVYTYDIEGQGLKARDILDTKRHYFNMGFSWFAVSAEQQGLGLGGYLHDWTVNMARARGAHRMVVQTDNGESEANAIALYEKRGYKREADVEDYYGPGRTLNRYYRRFDISESAEEFEPEETITEENKEEVLALGKELYSPERFEEFTHAVDLVLSSDEVASCVVREGGKVAGYAVLWQGVYDNSSFIFWQGARESARPALFETIRQMLASEEVEIGILEQEGEDPSLLQHGWQKPDPEKGIPYAFSTENDIALLFYSKDLTKK